MHETFKGKVSESGKMSRYPRRKQKKTNKNDRRQQITSMTAPRAALTPPTPATIPTNRDVTDSKSKSDGIWHFSGNLKYVGYLKSDCNGFTIFVSVQHYNYFKRLFTLEFLMVVTVNLFN